MSGKADVIFEVLSDGVIFFDHTGAPRFVNRVARELFGNRAGTLFTEMPAQKALAGFRNGTATFPLDARIEFARSGSLTTLDVSILEWKSGGGYIFILKEALGSDPIRGDLSIVFELLRDDLKDDIAAFIGAADQRVAGNPELRSAGKGLLERLEKLVAMAELFGSDEIVGSERVSLREIFDEAWPEIAPLAGQRFVKIGVQGLATDLPRVYGNRKWLKRALAEIVHNAVKHAIPGRNAEDLSLVDIDTRQDGHWITLKVRNSGRGVLPDVGGRVFMPFSRARVAARVPMTGLGIGLPLAHQIVTLHGGQMRLESSLGDKTDVTLMLPTGDSPRRDARLDIEQAQRYAEDLAKLLARRAKRESALS